LVSNSPYYAGWPLRNKSLICTTNRDYAAGYASGFNKVYAIFPFDGVKIAVCPRYDIWDTDIIIPEFKRSFESNDSNVSDFNRWISMNLEFPAEYSEMIAVISNPESKICKFAGKFGISNDEIMPILFKALSPKMLDFKLMSISEFASKSLINNECWIGGQVVAVQHNLYLELLKTMDAS